MIAFKLITIGVFECFTCTFLLFLNSYFVRTLLFLVIHPTLPDEKRHFSTFTIAEVIHCYLTQISESSNTEFILKPKILLYYC